MSEQRFWRDPALPFVESRRACGSGACYAPHTHPTLSIGVVDRGHSRFVCEGTVARLSPGDLVVVPAAIVHSCNPEGSAWSYQMLYLDRDWAAACGDGRPPFHAAVLRDEALYAAYCRVGDLLFSATPVTVKEAALHAFVGDLWRRLAGDALAPCARPARLARVRQLLAERCAEPWPLSALTEVAGMSRRRLIDAFKSETGMTPHAWLLDLRVNRAKALLRAGVPLAQVAQELCFADQSHLQRVFKRHAAITPKRYRQPG